MDSNNLNFVLMLLSDIQIGGSGFETFSGKFDWDIFDEIVPKRANVDVSPKMCNMFYSS